MVMMHCQLLDKACQEVETELRISTHSHLQLDSRNPFQSPLRDLSPLLTLEPFCLLDTNLISVKGKATHTAVSFSIITQRSSTIHFPWKETNEEYQVIRQQ